MNFLSVFRHSICDIKKQVKNAEFLKGTVSRAFSSLFVHVLLPGLDLPGSGIFQFCRFSKCRTKLIQHFFNPVPDWNHGCWNTDAGDSFLDADAQLGCFLTSSSAKNVSGIFFSICTISHTQGDSPPTALFHLGMFGMPSPGMWKPGQRPVCTASRTRSSATPRRGFSTSLSPIPQATSPTSTLIWWDRYNYIFTVIDPTSKWIKAITLATTSHCDKPSHCNILSQILWHFVCVFLSNFAMTFVPTKQKVHFSEKFARFTHVHMW